MSSSPPAARANRCPLCPVWRRPVTVPSRSAPTDFIIISARPIPGNEKTVTKVVNGLLALGAEVIYENMYDTHVSGHACQEEQKLMLTLAHPQYFLPVHGEFKQLKRHAETAEHLGYIPKQNIYIAENGQNIRLSRDGMAVEGTVPAGAVMVDGYGVGDVGNVVLRDRHHLSEDGIIIVTAAVDGSTGQLLSWPWTWFPAALSMCGKARS